MNGPQALLILENVVYCVGDTSTVNGPQALLILENVNVHNDVEVVD